MDARELRISAIHDHMDAIVCHRVKQAVDEVGDDETLLRAVTALVEARNKVDRACEKLWNVLPAHLK